MSAETPPAVRGFHAEGLVADAMERAGWQVLERNFRIEGGEIDIVAIREGWLRFVEVKARDPEAEDADECVPSWKIQHLRGAARAWLHTHPDLPHAEVAFLVVWVEGEGMRWLDNAFDVSD